MNIINDLNDLSLCDTAVCLGNFDGFHLGHKLVVSMMKSYADNLGLRSVIFTFTPHPMQFFCKDILLLSTPNQRSEIFAEQQVDYLVNAPFDNILSSLAPEDFFKNIIVDKLGAKVLVVGRDYRFGAGRSGGMELLHNLGEKYGVKCFFADKVKDSCGIDISSSRIRSLISEGNVEKAAECLGRNYCIDGVVIHGCGRGKEFGFPTANIKSENILIPNSGVYATEVTTEFSSYKSMTYIGTRPTVCNGTEVSIETNIFKLNKDIYDEPLRIYFKERIRGEIKFASIDELKSQMIKDMERAENCK